MNGNFLRIASLIAIIAGGAWATRSFVDTSIERHDSKGHIQTAERLVRIETKLDAILQQLDK